MTLDLDLAPRGAEVADWLFEIGRGDTPVAVDGLMSVAGFDALGHAPEVVAIMDKASRYGARFVFFEASRHGRAPIPQAFIFVSDGGLSDADFAALHQRLWSWGGVPLLYRAAAGRIDLFRCAHKADFASADGVPIYNPVRTLEVGATIAVDAWWDAARLRNGALWDDPTACRLMLSANGSAHRKLVESVRDLNRDLARERLLDVGLRRRLLILSLLIAYLEERGVMEADYFSRFEPGATRFFEVLRNGPALVRLLAALEERFNGHVFNLTARQRSALECSPHLDRYARLVEGYEDADGQMSLWKLYSFRDLPVELISNIYQLFVNDTASSVYTPPALVRTVLEEVLSWERLDALMESESVILDPACGSGVFLVEAYKRLVLHWRSRHGWERPGVDQLRPLLQRLHGVDLEAGAIELAAFSLCLALCDALEPEEIRASVKLFPRLAGATLHHSCFFDARAEARITAPVAVVVGNPPFASALTTPGARRAYGEYQAAHGALADKQLAYLFLHEAMEALQPDGLLAMIEPSGFLYNGQAQTFRKTFFRRWRVREILDFVSVRGLFKKGNADPKIVVVIAEAAAGRAGDEVLHAVFRRGGRAAAEQAFDIDYYDLHWLTAHDAAENGDVWRADLMGGARMRAFIERLRRLPTLRAYAEARKWDYGEGFIAGDDGKAVSAAHIRGRPLLPTEALTSNGLDASLMALAADRPVTRPRTPARFTPPLLLIKEHEDLHHGVWETSYLTYRNEIVGFAAPDADVSELRAVETWLKREQIALKAYVAGVSARLFTQRATAVLHEDVLALPYVEGGDLDLSVNEKIIAEDAVAYQRDFVRLGAKAPVMATASRDDLAAFDAVLTAQLSAAFPDTPVRAAEAHNWPGALCRAYVFGEGVVDWSGAEALKGKVDALLVQKTGANVAVTRIARIYDGRFLFLLKPDRLRFWTRSIALRDADEVFADLQAQGV